MAPRGPLGNITDELPQNLSGAPAVSPLLFWKGLRLLFGDQVMACRRHDFWQCGGFDDDLQIMEDGDLCLRLVKRGRIVQIHRLVRSSDRRVERWGAWKAALIYLGIGLLWGLGVSPLHLRRFYEDIR
jgi:GT2 family glycosyltransferase